MQKEDQKGPDADEARIARRLRNIKRMAPDILDAILTTIGNLEAGFGVIVKKVAEKIRSEAG